MCVLFMGRPAMDGVFALPQNRWALTMVWFRRSSEYVSRHRLNHIPLETPEPLKLRQQPFWRQPSIQMLSQLVTSVLHRFCFGAAVCPRLPWSFRAAAAMLVEIVNRRQK